MLMLPTLSISGAYRRRKRSERIASESEIVASEAGGLGSACVLASPSGDDGDMEAFEGPGWLEWWANSSTLLGSAEILLVVTTTGRDWVAQGTLIGESEDDREGFLFLRDLDPVFLLRLDGHDDHVLVTVDNIEGDGRRFTLTEYRGPRRRPIESHFAL